MAPLPPIARSITSHLSQISPKDLWQRIPSLHLQPRQSNIIPTTYGAINSGPSPGEVVGIVLGSVGGFLFIFWLIYIYANLSGAGEGSAYTESVVVREHRGGSSSQRSRRRGVRAETVEARRERTPVRVAREREPAVERVVVEEDVRRVRREPSVADSAEVVVIEEHSLPRRPKSKRERRGSRVVEEERFEKRESGFRAVDPLAYGGVVGGRRSSSRR